MIVYPKRYAIYDTETTGLDLVNDEIVELGVKVVERDGTSTTKSWLLRGNRPSCPEALAAHGITEEYRAEHGIDPKVALLEFIELVGDRPYVGHNILRYDNPLLAANLNRHALDARIMQRKFDASVDTAALYKALKLKEGQRWYETHQDFANRILDLQAPGVKFNLALACRELSLDVAGLKAHRAEADVEMVHKLFNKLTQ